MRCSSNHVGPELKQSVLSSFPHYGHSGVVAAARNLFTQIEGNAEDDGKYLIFCSFIVVLIVIVVIIQIPGDLQKQG